MLHGWLDSAVTFQFVVDALQEDWHVIAPDLRGHGGSHRTYESYFFLQLVADFDAMLERYAPDRPAWDPKTVATPITKNSQRACGRQTRASA